MGQLEVVNDHDEVIGLEDYEVVHSRGLRHRSVQVLVFSEGCLNWLVARRSREQADGSGLLHHLVEGHVIPTQTYPSPSYEMVALAELQKKLFHGRELPNGLSVVEVARYQNDTPTNRENTALFYAVHPGPFFPDPTETTGVEFQDRHTLAEDTELNPNDYKTNLRNAMRAFGELKSELRGPVKTRYILNHEEFIDAFVDLGNRFGAGAYIPPEAVFVAVYGQNQLRELGGRKELLPKDVCDLMMATAERILKNVGYVLRCPMNPNLALPYQDPNYSLRRPGWVRKGRA